MEWRPLEIISHLMGNDKCWPNEINSISNKKKLVQAHRLFISKTKNVTIRISVQITLKQKI